MFQQVILIGRVGIDPEVKETSGGKLAKFSLATWEFYKGKDGARKEYTTWHRIVCWNEFAINVEKYVKKGMKIQIVGKIVKTEWTDTEGRKHYQDEINLKNLVFLDAKRIDEGQSDSPVNNSESDPSLQRELPAQSIPSMPANLGNSDDLPF